MALRAACSVTPTGWVTIGLSTCSMLAGARRTIDRTRRLRHRPLQPNPLVLWARRMYPPSVFRDRIAPLLIPADGVDAALRANPPVDTALAGVLVPVLLEGGDPRLVFTRRTDTLSRHAGEISFPGGLADAGENLPRAALREAKEELGLDPSDVELLGALPSVH